jgi:hypothetical protein
MPSDSTELLYDTLRDRLLDYVPVEGNPLAERLGPLTGPRLYIVQAPDQREEAAGDQGWPYGVMRLSDWGGLPGERGLRHLVMLTLDVYDYPRRQYFRATGIVDTAHQACLHFVDADSFGLLFARASDVRRIESPVPTAPVMDRELVHLRLNVPFIVWPAYLTKASVP